MVESRSGDAPVADSRAGPDSLAKLVDYQTSQQRMGLFSQPGLGTHPNAVSCFSPDSAVTDEWWEDATPPPYDVAAAKARLESSQDRTVSGSRYSTIRASTSRERSNKSGKARSSLKKRFSKAPQRSYSRPFRPGISVNTSVSRHQGQTPRQMFPSSQRSFNALGSTPSSPEIGETDAGGWVSKVSHLKRSRESRRTKIKATTLEVARGIPDRLDGVTPSERAIPMGFLPSGTSTSAYLSAPQPREVAHLVDHTISEPPMISITPAQDSSGWSSPEQVLGWTKMPQAPRRPSSSVYSQVTSKSYAHYVNDTPPLPPLPGGFGPSRLMSPVEARRQLDIMSLYAQKRESEHTTFEEDAKSQERIMSTGTLFEEDQTPLSASSIQQHFTKKPQDLAIDTSLPMPRRSKGWWNVITTPFELNRSTTKLSRSPAEPDYVSPDGRNLPASHTRHESQQSIFSPNDRDVPLVLDGSSNQDHQVQIGSSHDLDAKALRSISPTHHQHEHVQSPTTGQTETPVLEVASLGLIHLAKTIEHSPNLATQQKSPQPGHSAGFVTLQNTHTPPTPPPKAKYVPHAQYMQAAAYLPRPLTTFPGSEVVNEKSAFKTPPIANSKVRSVWEEEEPKENGKKSKRKKGTNFKNDEATNKKKRKNRRCLLCCVCVSIPVFIALLIGLIVTLTRHHHGSAGKSVKATATAAITATFVNLTNFPPVPTGQMKIAQPTLLAQVNGCTTNSALWSCDLPKDDQAADQRSGNSVSDFRLAITFNNDTTSDVASRIMRFKRDLNGSPFEPSPAPPSEEDQIFLGNTTDHIQEPFQGEDTPFFISFIFTSDDSPRNRKIKRYTASRTSEDIVTTTTTEMADLATAIPSPSILDDGTAAPANLLPSPLPSNQPLKLYNRGKYNEHYGFYTYFDRSIFLRSIKVTAKGDIDPGQTPADQDGGSIKDGANARCTWTQTRFLVQIWTRMSAALVSASTDSSAVAGGDSNSTDSGSDASFPYPITITTDRHGGTSSGKMIYCYALDDQTRPVPLNKTIYPESRGFEGTLVNAQLGLRGVTIDPSEPASKGGIDGGTGGCGCRWGNWEDSRGFGD